MNFLRSGGVHFFVISVWWHFWKKILTFQEKVTLVTLSTKVPTVVHGRAVVKVLLGHCNKSHVFSDSCLEHYFLQPFQRKNKFRFRDEWEMDQSGSHQKIESTWKFKIEGVWAGQWKSQKQTRIVRQLRVYQSRQHPAPNIPPDTS